MVSKRTYGAVFLFEGYIFTMRNSFSLFPAPVFQNYSEFSTFTEYLVDKSEFFRKSQVVQFRFSTFTEQTVNYSSLVMKCAGRYLVK